MPLSTTLSAATQPFLTISLQTQAEDYKHLGHTLSLQQNSLFENNQ